MIRMKRDECLILIIIIVFIKVYGILQKCRNILQKRSPMVWAPYLWTMPLSLRAANLHVEPTPDHGSKAEEKRSISGEPLMSRKIRQLSLARVRRRDPLMTRKSRKLSLARVRRDPEMQRATRQLSLARVRRDPTMARENRRLSYVRVRRDPYLQRAIRPMSLARVRRQDSSMNREARQLSVARL